MKILARIEKSRSFWFLLITSVIFFLLRLPSLFEPYWYGDEGIYQVIGDALNSGRQLYSGIWDNKPPLLYLLYAVFHSDQFTVRLVSLVFGLLSVVAFFYLTRKLFHETKNGEKISIFVTFTYAVLFGLPIIEGNIANSENFMLFPIILAGFLIVKLIKKNQALEFNSKLIIPGILLSIAFLFKIVAIFDFAAFFVAIAIVELCNKRSIQKLFLNLIPFVLGFIIPIALTFLFTLLNGTLSDFIKATFTQMFGYVGYGNKFVIPQGLLIMKLSILLLFNLYILFRRQNLSISTIFVLVWLSFSVFNALFSQRPYTHYLLVLLPAFCLFLGLLIWDKKIKHLGLVLLIILFFVIGTFSYYKKTPRYYFNFVSFITGSKNLAQYQAFFDRNTPNDYQLAQFIKNNTTEKDNIFIWGNNAQVYKMSNKLPPGRFTVAYHITASDEYINETYIALKAAQPKFIIVTSPKNPIPFNLKGYYPKITINNSVIYEYDN